MAHFFQLSARKTVKILKDAVLLSNEVRGSLCTVNAKFSRRALLHGVC